MDIEPPFKKKSDNNLLAAQLLIQGENCALNENKISLANESVHCSYYAVLQFCKYFLMERKNIDEQQLNDILNLKKGKDSHKKIYTETADVLTKDGKSTEANNFMSDFEDLQEKRVKADYDEECINQAKSKECLSAAKHIIKQLSRYLKPKKK